jgi:predicted metal-dependent peptidase
MTDVQDKIDRAKIQLLMHEPFIGILLLSLQWIETKRVPTMGVTHSKLYWNPDFVESIGDEELKGVLAHETSHLMFQHVLDWRKFSGKVEPYWTEAMEYVCNDAVKNMFNLPLPGTDYFYSDEYKNMFTEEVYAKLLKDDPSGKRKQDQKIVMVMSGADGSGSGDSDEEGEGQGQGQGEDGKENPTQGKMVDTHVIEDGEPISAEEEQDISDRIKMTVSQAGSAAKAEGKMPAGLERIIGDLLNPQMPWRHLLAEFVMGFARDDFTMRRPNRNYLYHGMVMPSLRSEALEVAVAIDTSGSIGIDELTTFWSEIMGIMEVFPSYKIHLMGCDASVHSYQVADQTSEVDIEALMTGGGGTAFYPCFQKMEEEGIQPQAMIYLTDGYGSFSFPEPEYAVLWIMTPNHINEDQVPFGRVCVLDADLMAAA